MHETPRSLHEPQGSVTLADVTAFVNEELLPALLLEVMREAKSDMIHAFLMKQRGCVDVPRVCFAAGVGK